MWFDELLIPTITVLKKDILLTTESMSVSFNPLQVIFLVIT